MTGDVLDQVILFGDGVGDGVLDIGRARRNLIEDQALCAAGTKPLDQM